MSGSGLTIREMVPCRAMSPHTPKVVVRSGRKVALSVECNRPSGHEGDHMCSSIKTGPQYRWTRAGKVVY